MSKRKNEIRALYKRQGQNFMEIPLPNELDWMQGAVDDGPIEVVMFSADMALLVNEEGKLKGMEHNFYFLGDDIVGPALFVGVEGDEYTDCPVSVSYMKQVFPELEVQHGRKKA